MFIKINAIPVEYINLDGVDGAVVKDGKIRLTMKSGKSRDLDMGAAQFEGAIPLFTPPQSPAAATSKSSPPRQPAQTGA